MEYLQYLLLRKSYCIGVDSFKPYYKWNTFNTDMEKVIVHKDLSFKPYYKWNTFNTMEKDAYVTFYNSFKPYYKWNTFNTQKATVKGANTHVLNLIINGIPSILKKTEYIHLT